MPTIEIDFETFKEITRRRPNEAVTEGDVVREALGLPPRAPAAGHRATVAPATQFWLSEGVKFPIGTKLEHRFRDGRIVEAMVKEDGVEFNGVTYSGLSPAGSAATGHSLNGWLFWFVRGEDGRLVAADTLRSK